MQRYLSSSYLRAFIVTGIFLGCLQLGFAQVRSSTNYQLQSDSINIGGGLSSSTNYVQESTVGEIATDRSTSTSYQLRAGYQQMQEVYISLSAPGDVVLSPALGGITGGSSNGSTTVTVTTDSPSGYSLSLEAENNPAMKSGTMSIADYASSSATYDFTVLTGAAFGYSPSGIDIQNDFRDNGSACGTGGLLDAVLKCWLGLSTTPRVIAQATGSNHPAGATTTVNFRVGVASDAGVAAGLYTATTTLTALPL